MTAQEIEEVIERMIYIRDHYGLMSFDREALADACNLLEHNIDILAEKEEQKNG